MLRQSLLARLHSSLEKSPFTIADVSVTPGASDTDPVLVVQFRHETRFGDGGAVARVGDRVPGSRGCKQEHHDPRRGCQDVRKLAGGEKSLKHRKAEEFIRQGIPIQILRESEGADGRGCP